MNGGEVWEVIWGECKKLMKKGQKFQRKFAEKAQKVKNKFGEKGHKFEEKEVKISEKIWGKRAEI